MAESGTGLSHCPAPATLGGFPIIDMKAMQKAGMRVSLGCDGSATNDGSNLLDSLRMAYLMQSYHSKQRGGAVSAYEMLKIATVEGAAMMGREDIGSIEEGKGRICFLSMPGASNLRGLSTIRQTFLPGSLSPVRSGSPWYMAGLSMPREGSPVSRRKRLRKRPNGSATG